MPRDPTPTLNDLIDAARRAHDEVLQRTRNRIRQEGMNGSTIDTRPPYDPNRFIIADTPTYTVTINNPIPLETRMLLEPTPAAPAAPNFPRWAASDFFGGFAEPVPPQPQVTEETRMADLKKKEIVTKTGEAIKGGIRIIHVRVQRKANGIRVILTGGGEIREIFETLSKQEGYPQPRRDGLGCNIPLWLGGYDLSNVANTTVPSTPVLGPWVLRHAELGMAENVEFTLPLPHSRKYLERQIALICETAKKIFWEYCKVVEMTGEANTA